MVVKVYEYKKCSTCRSALKYLDSKSIAYDTVAIVEQPPTIKELERMLSYLKKDGKGLKNLFNTSGEQYRELKVSDQLKSGMSEDAALKLLSKNGKLIKRPFLLSANHGTTGFNAEEWDRLLRR